VPPPALATGVLFFPPQLRKRPTTTEAKAFLSPQVSFPRFPFHHGRRAGGFSFFPPSKSVRVLPPPSPLDDLERTVLVLTAHQAPPSPFPFPFGRERVFPLLRSKWGIMPQVCFLLKFGG